MAKDVIARLKSDTKQWDDGMSKAIKSLEKFKQENLSLDSAIQGSVKTLTSAAAKFVGWGAAAAGAMKVVSDSFTYTESGIDSWGRTVSGAEGAYNTFISTINGGNWSNFLTNLSDAINGASELYDKLDRLGSIKGNNAAAIAIREQALAQSRLRLQEAKSSGDKAQITALEDTIRKQSMELADLRKMEVYAGKDAGRAQMTEAMKSVVRGDSDLAGVNINNATWNRVAENIASGGQRYMDALAKRYADLTAKGTEAKTSFKGSYATGDARVETEYIFNINKLSEEEKKRYAVAKAVTEAETQIQKGISTYASAVQQDANSASQQFRYNRYAGLGSPRGGTGSGKGGEKSDSVDYVTGSVADLSKQIKALQDEQNNVATTSEVWSEYQAKIDALTERVKALKGDVKAVAAVAKEYATGMSIDSKAGLDAIRTNASQAMSTESIGSVRYNMAVDLIADANTMQNLLPYMEKYAPQAADAFKEQWGIGMAEGLTIPDEAWERLVATINEKMSSLGLEPIKLDFDTGSISKVTKDTKEMSSATREAFSAVNTLGGALQNIKNPAVNVAGVIAQAIANVALAYGDALAKDKVSKSNIFSFIAAAAASTISMVSTITAIKQNTKYADGGIVGGSSYVGDRIPIMANAGEVILNYTQQQTVAEGLERSMSVGSGNSIITGEQLVTVINAYGRRSGRGEILR